MEAVTDKIRPARLTSTLQRAMPNVAWFDTESVISRSLAVQVAQLMYALRAINLILDGERGKCLPCINRVRDGTRGLARN